MTKIISNILFSLLVVVGVFYSPCSLLVSAQTDPITSTSCLHTFSEGGCAANTNCLWCSIQGFGHICLPRDDGQSISGSQTILGVSCSSSSPTTTTTTQEDRMGNTGPSSASSENAVAIAPESPNQQVVNSTPANNPANSGSGGGQPAQPAQPQAPPAAAAGGGSGPINMRNDNDNKPYFTKRTTQNNSVNIYSCK